MGYGLVGVRRGTSSILCVKQEKTVSAIQSHSLVDPFLTPFLAASEKYETVEMDHASIPLRLYHTCTFMC